MSVTLVALGIAVAAGFYLIAIAAFVTHVVACIQAQAWILLLIGVLIPSVGATHGGLIWFGIPRLWMRSRPPVGFG